MSLFGNIAAAVRVLLSGPPPAGLTETQILSDPKQVAARTAWGEARDQGTIGMHAVLSTIGNRARTPGWWGHDVLTVCLARNQYSCWHAADPNFPKLMSVTSSDVQFRAALALADQLVAGTLDDITGGADSYFVNGTPRPPWATGRRFLRTIGSQSFYRVGIAGLGAILSGDDQIHFFSEPDVGAAS